MSEKLKQLIRNKTNKHDEIKKFLLEHPHLTKRQLIRKATRGNGITAKLRPFYTKHKIAKGKIGPALNDVYSQSGDLRAQMYDIASNAKTPEEFKRRLFKERPASRQRLTTLLGGDTPLFMNGSKPTKPTLPTLEDIFFKAKIRNAAMVDEESFNRMLKQQGVAMKDVGNAYVKARKAAVTKVIYDALSEISKNTKTRHTYDPDMVAEKVLDAIKLRGMQSDYTSITERIDGTVMSLKDMVNTALRKGLQRHGARKLHSLLFEPLRSAQRMVNVSFRGSRQTTDQRELMAQIKQRSSKEKRAYYDELSSGWVKEIVLPKYLPYIAGAKTPNANMKSELRRARDALKNKAKLNDAASLREQLLRLKFQGKALTKEQVRLFLGDSFEGFQPPKPNISKSNGMIFFKLGLKRPSGYDYWYVKIEDSCAALSTVADLFDYEQVKHAGGVITKIGLKQGKIPSAFRRSEKTFRNETLQFISLDNPGATYGLTGKQVEEYDSVVNRILEKDKRGSDKRGSEIVVRPQDVPSKPEALYEKLREFRNTLKLTHGGVFILPVTPGGPQDEMILRLHEEGLGRLSSHQKLFPGAGEARIMCLNANGGFSPPNMFGRKLIKPSLDRRKEMIKRVKNSIPTGWSTLNNNARARIAEQAVRGKGPLGIAPSNAQLSGFVGIGLVWWPILVVCITGIVTGVQAALGVERSVISRSWWGLGVSAALHLFFSGDVALERERMGAVQETDARKMIFDVVQKKANSRFMLTMGVMCVFLGALRGGHGPLSEPTRVTGIVLAVASVLGFVLFLREGLSVPKYQNRYGRREERYARRVEEEKKRLAATRLQTAVRGVAARRAQSAGVAARRAQSAAAEARQAAATRIQAATRGVAARRAQSAAATRIQAAGRGVVTRRARAAATRLPRTQSANTSNKFEIQSNSGTIKISWPELTSVQVSRSQSGGNAERIRLKTQALGALGLTKNATVPEIKNKLKQLFPERASFIEKL